MKIKYWDKSSTGLISTTSEERNIKVGHFSDCTIEGMGVHYPMPIIKTGEELLLPTIERFMSLGRGTAYEEDMNWECSNKNITKVEKRPVFYFVYNCANYFHWLYDTVPYLYSYLKEKKDNKNLKLLVNAPEGKNELYPFVYETLNLLGIEKDDLIFLDKETKYERMIIASSLTHNRMSLNPPHSALYKIMDLMEGSKNKEERIYISRRTWTQSKSENIGTDYTQERMCINEDKVVEIFKHHGFKEVFCENLSMKEKIGLFRNAKLVAGPIGGGMANVLFCKPETKVLSINSPEFFPTNKRLEYALCHTNLHMFDDTEFVDRKKEVVAGSNPLSISGGLNSQWKVDINALKQKLEEMLNE